MIAPLSFYHKLLQKQVTFFTGVPDSLMKQWLLCLEQEADANQHIVAVNEGAAIALAAGYHLRTRQLPLVYMQNSGLGNAINAFTSLTNREVYSIPMLLLIGWRGAPGVSDEPQHEAMGRITESLLSVLNIPGFILPATEQQAAECIDNAVETAVSQQQPVAILVKPATFIAIDHPQRPSPYTLSRETVIRMIMDSCKDDELFVCTTGKTAREFDTINQTRQQGPLKYFLSVGTMGLANQVALGIDQQSTGKTIMIDGDGALLMHMGTLASIGQTGSHLFTHVLINNGCHESVGGQPTLGFQVDFCAIARACGYSATTVINTDTEMQHWLQHEFRQPVKQFVEIRTNALSREDLARPTGLLTAKKEKLMTQLQNH